MKRKIIYVDNFLTAKGHTPTTGTTLVKLFKEEGYTVISTSNKRNKTLRLADMLLTIVNNRSNAVVLISVYSTSAFYFASMCAFVCRLFHIPYISCLHGGNLPARIKRSPYLSAGLFGKSYMNVAVSGYLQKSMTENRWKSVIIPNNINIELYPYRARKTANPALLWVRSFHNIYNPSLAVKLVHNLVQKYPQLYLTMAGPAKDGSINECRALIKKLGLEKNITITGLLAKEEWISLSASHDIFINTTNFDNLPVSVVEAMALGMVVISTKVGGVPYLIKDRENGILVPPDNVSAFTQAVEIVLEESQLAEKLSTAARVAAEQYDWKNIKQLWEQVLDIPSVNSLMR